VLYHWAMCKNFISVITNL